MTRLITTSIVLVVLVIALYGRASAGASISDWATWPYDMKAGFAYGIFSAIDLEAGYVEYVEKKHGEKRDHNLANPHKALCPDKTIFIHKIVAHTDHRISLRDASDESSLAWSVIDALYDICDGKELPQQTQSNGRNSSSTPSGSSSSSSSSGYQSPKSYEPPPRIDNIPTCGRACQNDDRSFNPLWNR